MSFIERRYQNDRRKVLDRRRARAGFDENRLELEERRKADRRKHCMHCGTPYVAGPTSAKICICRTLALRGPGHV